LEFGLRAVSPLGEQGVWDAMLRTLIDLGLTDDWQHMIDSTTIRGHVSAAGGKWVLLRRLLVDRAADLTGLPVTDPEESFVTDRLINNTYVFETLDLTPSSIATSFTTALAPVPEPSTWTLSIIGMGAMASY
jgi:hypothetical protein